MQRGHHETQPRSSTAPCLHIPGLHSSSWCPYPHHTPTTTPALAASLPSRRLCSVASSPATELLLFSVLWQPQYRLTNVISSLQPVVKYTTEAACNQSSRLTATQLLLMTPLYLCFLKPGFNPLDLCSAYWFSFQFLPNIWHIESNTLHKSYVYYINVIIFIYSICKLT